MSKQKFKKIWYLVGLLVLANLAVWAAQSKAEVKNFGKLYFFDVGQGDAIYLRTVAGNDVLIDTGPGDAVVSKLGRVMPYFDRKLELVILTHPHADHISGMAELLKRYKVEKVLFPNAEYDSATYRQVLGELAQKDVLIIRPKLGQRIFLDDSTVLDIYYPIVQFDNPEKIKDINDISVVAKLSFGQMNVLLTGDAGRDIETLLEKFDLPLAAEIFKVGHHGSKHSSGLEFIERASSSYAVISVGKNSYGHPHEEILGILREAKTRILRTDEDGNVIFELYPDRVVLSKEK